MVNVPPLASYDEQGQYRIPWRIPMWPRYIAPGVRAGPEAHRRLFAWHPADVRLVRPM